MSSPEIALHKSCNTMEDKGKYHKRTQRDYSMSMKLEIVGDIEKGILSTTGVMRKYGIQSRSTVVRWLRKHGNFDWINQTPSNMPKSPERKILEL